MGRRGDVGGNYRMQLNASTRQIVGKRSRRLHREGKLAAVVYGHAAAATPLVLDRLEFQKVFVKSGRTHLLDLVVDGSRTEKVLIREIQTHPRRLGPIHVDFYQVNLEEKIRVEVPIHLIGESAAVKRGDADVLQPIHALEVECLPTEIPAEFEVDLTPLAEIDDGLRVSELAVPKGITILADPGEQLRHRGARVDIVVLSRRVAYVVVIGIGVMAAFSFAFQTANVTLVGILLATVVAAFGVQELLQDYVSGYYILLERHIRVGDRIVLDGHTGDVVEVKLRVTLVRTAEGDLLVVPNSELFTKPVLVRAKGSPEAHAAKEAEAAKPSEHQG